MARSAECQAQRGQAHEHPLLAENWADGNNLCELIDEKALPPGKDKPQLHQAVAVVAQRAFNSVQELERQRPRA